jgi:hypothetical protein
VSTDNCGFLFSCESLALFVHSRILQENDT